MNMFFMKSLNTKTRPQQAGEELTPKLMSFTSAFTSQK
jgi:hypothetical protein